MLAIDVRFSLPRNMEYFLNILFIFNVLASAVANTRNCQTIFGQRDNRATYLCSELTNLFELEKANTNTTNIEISESKISHLSGHSFARFGGTLVTLDLHGSGIETIDSLAFVGLTKLENLILWGNKLRYVPRDWFMNTYSLKTLDLSFNSIEVIDYAVFELLPNLENFYFDYNQIKFIDYSMFAYLRNLKTVKFEKNPLSWGFRAHLVWQMENQHVKYSEDWEDWGWMNVVIKECAESGYGEIPKDTVLDCIVEKLLDYTYQVFSTRMIQQNIECSMKARQLVRCMRPKNGTGNTDNETVRRILEDYTAILPIMSRSLICRCQPVLTIYRLRGAQLEIQMSCLETIGYLKKQLSKLLYEQDQIWKPERMRLWLRGTFLEDNRLISDYRLTCSDRIVLLLDDHS